MHTDKMSAPLHDPHCRTVETIIITRCEEDNDKEHFLA